MPEPLLHIVLFQPRIPQNTGNVARLCIGLGARLHLVEPLGFELSEKRVRRAGLDYWPALDLRVHPFSWSPAEIQGRFFLFTKRAPASIFAARFQRGDWLVFGSEDTGLPENILNAHSERCLSLPLYGPIRSQNLASAVAAAGYLALADLHRNGEIPLPTD